MIVKMSRVYIAVRQVDRDKLLDRLGRMNLLHFQPVKPEEAVADEETLKEIAEIDRALEILRSITPAGRTPSKKFIDIAREAIEIQATIIDNQDRLNDLRRRIEDLSLWGDVRLCQFEALLASGVDVRFFLVSRTHVDNVRAECCEIICALPRKRVLMAVVDRTGQFMMPEGSEPVPLPSYDRNSLLTEAKKVDIDLKHGFERLAQLAALTEDLQAERARLLAKTTYVKAQRSGLTQGELFAVQGWLPAEKVESLKSSLSADEFPTVVLSKPATEEDVPPTLIQYPIWARPIKGFFDMLGTLPGYREMDLSPFFMVALPIFAAMLIGDAGYGLLILLVGILFYKRIAHLAGRDKAQILIIFGLVTFFWGTLTANYFGVTPETLAIRWRIRKIRN